jgi:regulator of sigma E protease
MSTLITILLVILILGILVFIHELGHFLAARLVGATVLEFALGFGPRILSKEYKGTVYSIRLLPLGGFVNILGDGDPTKEELEKLKDVDIEEGNLKNKSKLAQAFVMLAGIFMNIFLAILFYYVVLGFSGWKIDLSYEFADFNPVGAKIVRERESDVPYEIIDGGSADRSGMPKGGYIKSIDGSNVEYVEDISALIQDNSFIDVEACNSENICNIYNVEVNEDGKIGIAIGANYFVSIDYSDYRVFAGFSHFINDVRLIGRVFGSLFREARQTGDYSMLSQSVSGPVGIFFLVDYFKDLGWIPLISLIADLSLSLAIMNILPIPALDGGRVLIVAIEGVLHKDLDHRVESIIINVSFIVLMVFIVFVMIKDIVNIDQLKSLFE